MNIDLSLIKRGVVAAALIFGFQAAQAATLGATGGNPDVATSNATLDYSFTSICSGISANGDSGTGECGTDNGLNGKNSIDYTSFESSLSGGVLTLSGTSMILDADGNSLDFVAGGSTSIIANFDGNGSFVDGTVSLTGTALSGDTNFQSGTLVTGDLTDFGYGGADAGGTFDFFFDNVGGDFASFYNGYAAIIINTTTLSPATGNWDTGGLDFQADFSATSADIDTLVPIPATAWLLGSGLLGMFGWARRKRNAV